MTAAETTQPRRFRPGLWPTAITVPALIILVALGTWQVQRLSWKTDLIDRIEAQVTADPVPLPGEIDNPADWDFRRVTVTGRYDDAAGQLNLLGRTSDTGRAGQHLVALLTVTDGPAAGRTLLVDRGWIPAAFEDADARAEAAVPEGPVTLTGVLRQPRPPGWMQPENDPADNAWFTHDPVAMAAALGADPATVMPMVLERGADRQAPVDALPRGGRTRIDLPNNHLQYAVTWYSLAAVLAAVYAISQFRRPTDPKADPPQSQ